MFPRRATDALARPPYAESLAVLLLTHVFQPIDDLAVEPLLKSHRPESPCLGRLMESIAVAGRGPSGKFQL
jgi:hypothetical protein